MSTNLCNDLLQERDAIFQDLVQRLGAETHLQRFCLHRIAECEYQIQTIQAAIEHLHGDTYGGPSGKDLFQLRTWEDEVTRLVRAREQAYRRYHSLRIVPEE